MSIENAKSFYKRMEEDTTFRQTFAEMSEEERQKFRLDSGYDFTAEEWQKAADEVQAAQADQELSEDQLEAIAGGLGLSMFPMYGGVFPDSFSF